MTDVCKISLDIIKAYLSNKEYLNPLTEEECKEVFTLLQKHDLGHLAGIVMPNCAYPFLVRSQYIAAFKYEEFNYEKQRIYQVFEENSIKFIPLKGAVIDKWYVEPWHRSRSDIDIIVPEEDLERASNALVKSLGYTKKDKLNNHDLQMYSPKGVHLELHYDFYDVGISAKNAMEYTVSITKNQYSFSPDFFVLYHIAHMAKHFRHGGCGIRALIDLFLIRKNLETDKEKLDKLLINYKLKKFAESMFELTDVWFCDKESNKFYDKLTEYIAFGGVYGTLKNRVLVEQTQQNGKVGYMLSRIFIKNDILKFQYPVLQKHAWLYPFCQAARWVNILTTKRFYKVKKEYRENKKINKLQESEIAYILNELELLD